MPTLISLGEKLNNKTVNLNIDGKRNKYYSCIITISFDKIFLFEVFNVHTTKSTVPFASCINFVTKEDASDVTAMALRILLDHQVPIVEVKRGKSLESAYLELTS